MRSEMFAEPGLPGLSCDTKESRDRIVLPAGSDYYNTDTCWAQSSVLLVQTPVMIILWKKSECGCCFTVMTGGCKTELKKFEVFHCN